jgi:hypothetical protein
VCYLVLTQTTLLPWQIVSVSEINGLYTEIASLKSKLGQAPAPRPQLAPLGTTSSLDRGAYNRDSNVMHRPVYGPNGYPMQQY